jgi:isocitrate lyase
MERQVRGYRHENMTAYARLQAREFELAEDADYGATTHQRFVGAGYFDAVATAISGSTGTDTAAMHGSTEEEQFAQVGH